MNKRMAFFLGIFLLLAALLGAQGRAQKALAAPFVERGAPGNGTGSFQVEDSLTHTRTLTSIPIKDAYPPDDTFDGMVLDPYKWQIRASGGGDINQVENLIAEVSGYDPSSSASVISTWSFCGNFDMQVDFNSGDGWGVPMSGHLDEAIFGVSLGDERYQIVRQTRADGSQVFEAWSSSLGPLGETPSTTQSGRLRITRESHRLSFFYNAGAGWQRLTYMNAPRSAARVFMGNASVEASRYLTSYFDNFQINSGFTDYVFHPAPPALIKPLNYSDLSNNRPVFRWKYQLGAIGYTLQIGMDSDFSSLFGSYTLRCEPLDGFCLYTPGVDLPVDTYLSWRVQAKGLHGPSAWSEVFDFHTAYPPSTPKLLLPANNALTRDYTPLLVWSQVTVPDGAPDFAYYRVQIGSDVLFYGMVYDQNVGSTPADSQWTPPGPLPAYSTFYWRVMACNNEEACSDWSAVRKFRTK